MLSASRAGVETIEMRLPEESKMVATRDASVPVFAGFPARMYEKSSGWAIVRVVVNDGEDPAGAAGNVPEAIGPIAARMVPNVVSR